MAESDRASGVLELIKDADYFRVDLVAGRRYYFELVLGASWDYYYNAPRLVLLDAAGSRLFSSDQAGGATAADRIGFSHVAVRSGPHYLLAKLSGEAGGTMPYQIAVGTIPPDDEPDLHVAALPLVLGTAVAGTFDLPAERDSFGLDLAAGQRVLIQVSGAATDSPQALRYRARLYGPDDAQLDPLVVATASKVEFVFVADAAGRYTLDLLYRPSQSTPAEPRPGSYTVVATAQPADDHGDLARLATPVVLDTAFGGVLDRPGDSDYFRIELPAAERYRFSLGVVLGGAAPNRAYLTVLDASGQPLELTTTTSPQETAVDVVQGGTYYLRVKAWEGERSISPGNPQRYELRGTRQTAPDDDDHGDQPGAATFLAVGAMQALRFESPSDVDVFRTDALAGQRLAFRFSGTGFQADMWVEGAGDLLGRGHFSTRTVIDESEYVIYYTAPRSVPVYLHLRPAPGRPHDGRTGFVVQVDALPADDHADHPLHATPLPLDTPLVGEFDSYLDHDWFRLELQAGQRYRFQAGAATMELFDGEGHSQFDREAGTSSIYTADAAFVATYSGSYFLALGARTSASYTLTVNRIAADDHADLPAGATMLDASLPYEALGLSLSGGSSADDFRGGRRSDALRGEGGNDTLSGGGADDRLDGGPGIDTAVFGGVRSAYQVLPVDGGLRVTARTGDEGIDDLQGIERLRFDGTSGTFAFDFAGHAGQVARIIGALFGRGLLKDPNFVGLGLELLDNGLPYPDLVALAVSSEPFARLAGSHSNADFVAWVYLNVVGSPPSMQDLATYTGLLDRGDFTQATLALLACNSELTATRIDLVGLASEGLLAYLPG